MKLSQFKFFLPQDLIEDTPPDHRGDCKLMVLHRKTKTIEHREFRDILDYFNEGDLFVMNNSMVSPSVLKGIKEKTEAEIEVFLLRELNSESRLWDVLVDPARKIRIGNKLYFGENEELVAEVIDNTTSRGRTLRFQYDGNHDEFKDLLKKLGRIPLPKIHRRGPTEADNQMYQTLYASREGSIAAPTAGMHLSREILKRMEIKGIDRAEVTLHIGVGNFRSIEVEDLTKHKPDSEEMEITQETVDIINTHKLEGKQVVAVGTTTVKVLESAVSIPGKVKQYKGWTNKFIFPPYTCSVPTAMITNFHLPLSPMLMLTASFGGYDLVMKAYKEAIEKKYKFFTYGDAMLIID